MYSGSIHSRLDHPLNLEKPALEVKARGANPYATRSAKDLFWRILNPVWGMHGEMGGGWHAPDAPAANLLGSESRSRL